jgi:hypothetical protein
MTPKSGLYAWQSPSPIAADLLLLNCTSCRCAPLDDDLQSIFLDGWTSQQQFPHSNESAADGSSSPESSLPNKHTDDPERIGRNWAFSIDNARVICTKSKFVKNEHPRYAFEWFTSKVIRLGDENVGLRVIYRKMRYFPVTISVM